MLRELAGFGPQSLERRIDILTTIVLDLMMEVEALREAGAEGSDYAHAYRKAGLLTHNAAGPCSGWDKLLWRFYPRDKPVNMLNAVDHASQARSWRESLMMERLGFTAEEVAAYRLEAEEAETYT